jgi:hypothetical protein
VLRRELKPSPPKAAACQTTVWLDIDHGFAVRQIENRQSGDSLQRNVNRDFVAIVPGVWFPKKIEWQRFAPPDAPKEYQGRPVWILHTDLTKWIVNSVPDELFDVPMKTGDDVHDLRLNEHP